MKCVKCGKTIPENSKFCQYCGVSLERLKKIDIDNKNVVECPACGVKIKKENSFCTNCGAALQKTQKHKTEQKVRRKKQRKNKSINIFLILIIVIIAIFISVVSLYFLKSGNNDNQANYIEATEDDFFDEESLSDTEDEVMAEDQLVDSTQSTESNIDVDNEVEQINNQCDNIESSISAGIYNTIDIENGTIAYYDTTGLKAILDKEDGNYYYFDNDNLIFVYYEMIHPYKFYFQDDQLIRWSYLPSPGDDLNAVNNDQDKSWESSILEEAEDLKNKWVLALASVSTTQANVTTTQPAADTTQTNENISEQYILDGSDSRYISSSELDGLTAQEVKLARNEIYARHGRKFEDKAIRKYFKQFSWYHPSIEPEDFDESLLNNFEIANRDLIVQYEEEHGYR
ncbi:Double zinc ribbon [Eubacteriaceae bacterium CHKCI004]|nr:Double zinc ribbon [Eubacteriaceae bacterium CHKCI004]